MSEFERPTNPLSPDDALPTVEPPSMKFIVQLFVVPGVIVAMIVLVWLGINWLSHSGEDPRSFVTELRRSNQARWYAAVNLANAMNRPDQDHLKKDEQFASDLAKILDDELETGGNKEEAVKFQTYLCLSLGEFQVDAPLEVLIKAANLQRGENDLPVRQAALQALAVLVYNLRQREHRELTNPQLTEAVLKASHDSDALLRSTAAYTLGVLNNEQARKRLIEMLTDDYRDARYNAATGLAREGREEARDVLLEMLDPEEQAGVELEKDAKMKETKRLQIFGNAIKAVHQLAEANPNANLTPYIEMSEKAIAVLPKREQAAAQAVLEKIRAEAKKRDLPAEKP